MEDKSFILEEKNNTNKILITIIIILLLALGGLSYYAFLGKDKITKEELKVEEGKQEEVNSNKVYSTYISDTNEIDKLIINIPYSNIISKNISHNQLWKTYTIFNILKNLKSTSINDIGLGNSLKDSNGVIYPEYPADSEESLAKNFGLTVDEISRIDKEVWEVGGSINYNLFDVNDIKTKYNNIYEEMFKESFILFGIDYNTTISFDKNVNVLMNHVSANAPDDLKREIKIINRNNDTDLYKVDFTEKITREIENFEQTSNYEITFKLVNGYYQFDNIVKK